MSEVCSLQDFSSFIYAWVCWVSERPTFLFDHKHLHNCILSSVQDISRQGHTQLWSSLGPHLGAFPPESGLLPWNWARRGPISGAEVLLNQVYIKPVSASPCWPDCHREDCDCDPWRLSPLEELHLTQLSFQEPHICPASPNCDIRPRHPSPSPSSNSGCSLLHSAPPLLGPLLWAHINTSHPTGTISSHIRSTGVPRTCQPPHVLKLCAGERQCCPRSTVSIASEWFLRNQGHQQSEGQDSSQFASFLKLCFCQKKWELGLSKYQCITGLGEE